MTDTAEIADELRRVPFFSELGQGPLKEIARSARQKKIYRQSDAVERVNLPEESAAPALVPEVAAALESEDRRKTELACQKLASVLTGELGVPPVRVKVLAARPSRNWGELHGLYTAPEASERAEITIWMRTAQRRQVVAFRTFLRTLLHELGHEF